MTGLSRRLTRLEQTILPGEMTWSFMDRYNEIHRIALKRLSSADRILLRAPLRRLPHCPSSAGLAEHPTNSKQNLALGHCVLTLGGLGNFTLVQHQRS